ELQPLAGVVLEEQLAVAVLDPLGRGHLRVRGPELRRPAELEEQGGHAARVQRALGRHAVEVADHVALLLAALAAEAGAGLDGLVVDAPVGVVVGLADQALDQRRVEDRRHGAATDGGVGGRRAARGRRGRGRRRGRRRRGRRVRAAGGWGVLGGGGERRRHVPPVLGGSWAAVAIDAATSAGVTGGVPSSCTTRVLPCENSSTGLAAATAAVPSSATAARSTAATQDLPASTEDTLFLLDDEGCNTAAGRRERPALRDHHLGDVA